MTKVFSDMLDWKLKVGSHEFPGPEGGTCINEAAIIAAGFEYKSVSSWKDCPPCFSPFVSQFAIYVNDTIGDEDRQKLLPYVLKMAGTRGDDEFEMRRHHWFIAQIVNNEIANALYDIKEFELSKICKDAASKEELKAAIQKTRLSTSLLSLLLSLLSFLLSTLSLSLSLLSLLSLASRKIELLDGLINFEKPPTEIDQSTAVDRMKVAMGVAIPNHEAAA